MNWARIARGAGSTDGETLAISPSELWMTRRYNMEEQTL
jgi:hypothetical protein